MIELQDFTIGYLINMLYWKKM